MKVRYKAYDFAGDPLKVKLEIDSIIEKTGDATPEKIVEMARDSSTELYKCFTWDDKKAADKWRLHEARVLVCNIVVDAEDAEEETTSIRCFYKTDYNDGYKPTKIIVQQPDEYKKLLNNALAELEAFQRKYKALSELESVLDAISNLIA